MRCLDHNSMCSLICQVKDCPKKLLCNQCMVKHNPTHYSMIQSISDLDYQISQVPQLIEKDLDKLKMKLYQIQNHIVLEKEQLKKQFLKMLDVLKSRLSAEIDDFCSNTLDYTNSYYKSFETDVGTLLSVIANHVNIVAPYATRVRPLNESQFQMLIDFQEKMLTNVMPTLTKKAEVLSKQVFENPLHMKTDNFYAIVKTYLNKGLQAYNLFHNNQNQIEQKKALEMKLDEPYLSKSHLLPLNDDYKQSAREVLRDHYSLERKSAREQLQKSQFNLPKIKSVTELYSPQRNIYNYQKQLNTILTGHTDIITCICILTPTQLLSGGGGGAIRIWDLDSAISLGQFNEHAGDVWALAKINDIHFASASADQTVRIWNYSKMICESILVGHVEPIMALIYLRDVDYLASGSTDTSIKIWQAGRAKLKMTIQDSQKIKCLCYIEIKGLLLSGGNGAIKVFNILNGYCRDQLEGHQGEVYALRHLQDTLLGEQVSIVASGGADQKIMIWNVDKGLKLQIFTGHQDTINGLAYDIENNQLWSISSDRSIKVWDLIRGKLLVSMKKHSEQISCIEFMKQRELVITGSWDHKIRVCSRSLYFT